jgi:putative ABC transport system permease protein
LIIAVVILLSSGAATMALNLLVESDAPYDHAFAQANGAHLTLTFAADQVGEGQLRATASTPGVTAAGPWAEVSAPFSTPVGDRFGVAVVGRADPGGPIDRLTIESGRWARTEGEIVLSQGMADRTGLGIGDQVTAARGAGPTLRVVGIAASISPITDAWVIPGQVAALVTAQAPLSYQMLYRVTPAGTTADLRAATQAITRHLPVGSVVDASNYLDVKLRADQLTAVMIPFLLAFSAFALLAAALIIANVISGVVIASYREIGVMKSVGFTPGQVMVVLFGQILVPVGAGCLAGIPFGTLASQPFLRDTAHALGLPVAFTAALWVDLLVFAGVLVLALLAALAPAWRAGHLSAVTAITRGTAPAAGREGGIDHALARLPLPRPVSLGLGDALARPVRSATTLGAILIGAVTIVFALNLHLSLTQVAAHLIRDPYVQVDVYRPVFSPIQGKGIPIQNGPAPGPALSDRRIAALIAADPATARFVAETSEAISMPGIAEPIPYYAYRGPSSWVGYALIAGRWFSSPGEVVAPTKVFTQGHLKIGDMVTARIQGTPVRLRLVGEIFDQTGDDLLLRGTWATLTAASPGLQPDEYEVGLTPGANAEAYSQRLDQAAAHALDVRVVESSSANTSFVLLNTVIAGLALVLTAIAVAGVFNTVLLSARERTRDIAILKTVGMSPRQVVAMVVASMAFLGLIAGVIALPVGLELHRQILQFMGRISSGTNIPPSFFDLIGGAMLAPLALSGAVVAALGAWLPAQWAASSGVTEVLQSE